MANVHFLVSPADVGSKTWVCLRVRDGPLAPRPPPLQGAPGVSCEPTGGHWTALIPALKTHTRRENCTSGCVLYTFWCCFEQELMRHGHWPAGPIATENGRPAAAPPRGAPARGTAARAMAIRTTPHGARRMPVPCGQGQASAGTQPPPDGDLNSAFS